MSAIASWITSLTTIYLIVYSRADQRKHQSSASLAFVRRIHRRPVNSPHKGLVTRMMLPFDDVIIDDTAATWTHCCKISKWRDVVKCQSSTMINTPNLVASETSWDPTIYDDLSDIETGPWTCVNIRYDVLSLTRWGREKMSAAFQTTLSNAFSWKKMLSFWLKFHWSLFLMVLKNISNRSGLRWSSHIKTVPSFGIRFGLKMGSPEMVSLHRSCVRHEPNTIILCVRQRLIKLDHDGHAWLRMSHLVIWGIFGLNANVWPGQLH